MISLYDILEASNGQLFGEPAAQLFTDFCLNPEQAAENKLFIALKTDQGDTHPYIAEAIANGVSGVVCMQPPEVATDGVSVILVRDSVEALLAWSHFVLGKSGAKIIGVAGSVGKSVAIEAIGLVLGTRFAVHSESFAGEGRLSLPLSLAKFNPSHKFVVLKMATTQPGEMATMVQAAQPEVGVITQIGDMHTDHFDGQDELSRELSVLIDYLSPAGLAVLNYDSDLVRAMGSHTRAHVTTIGIDGFGADMMAYGVVVGLDGTGFDLRYASERHVGRWTALLGKQHLYSVMAALMIGLHYGVPLEEGLKVLTNLRPLPGCMNSLIAHSDSLLIDDTYSANPQSTLAALDWLASIKGERGRTIVILGDMENLGTGSHQGHRMIGRRTAQVADVLIAQGVEAAVAARAALDEGMDPRTVQTTYNAQDTVALLERNFQPTADDTILLKGGATSRLELVTEALLKDSADRERLPRRGISPEAETPFLPTRPSWIEIDSTALADNIRALKTLIGPDVTLMAVVKADGYGHGAVLTAQTALLNGAGYLGVSSLQEALELRDAGIEAPILIMSYTPAYLVRQAIQQNITISIYDLDLARAYEAAARDMNTRLRAHVKIDSGMGRLGILPKDAVAIFRHLTALRHIEIEGLYTHFSSADESGDYTEHQISIFKGVLRPLQATTGFRFKYVHAANSAATLVHKDAHFTMVRTGLAMYGLNPSETLSLPDDFRPVMSWKTVIAQVKTLPPGHPVGYGNTYTTRDEERIAVIPVGYADGLRRSPNNWSEVLIRGKRAPIVGRVSMEKTAINVTAIPQVSLGDEVVLLGRQGNEGITADEIARRLGTINYEVVTSILPRVPRR